MEKNGAKTIVQILIVCLILAAGIFGFIAYRNYRISVKQEQAYAEAQKKIDGDTDWSSMTGLDLTKGQTNSLKKKIQQYFEDRELGFVSSVYTVRKQTRENGSYIFYVSANQQEGYQIIFKCTLTEKTGKVSIEYFEDTYDLMENPDDELVDEPEGGYIYD